MISLIPCYSLEDFSLYRKPSEVDEILSAWSALYHPALVAHFGEAPRWEPAGSPSAGKQRRLVVIPPCAEALVQRSWLKSAEEEGALIIRKIADRDDILKEIFSRLQIPYSPDPSKTLDVKESVETNANEEAPSETVEAEQTSATAPSLPYDDDVESFLSAGLSCLFEELLTRKLRYMSNLDQVNFKGRIVDAAKAYMANDAKEREKNLQKAFDLLAQAKEYFFPTATKFLDLTWVLEEDLGDPLFDELSFRQRRNEKTNLVLPVPLLLRCERDYPKTFALLRAEVDAKRVSIVGSDRWEGPLYLQEPLELARSLKEGRKEYERALGIAPTTFGRQEAGYAQIMPQILRLCGYKSVLSRTGDGWSLGEKKGDRAQFRWQGRDGSIVAAFCKKPLDATNSEEILQLPDKIGNSYYSDDASSISFEHRPGKESRWLRDLMRADRYSPVLGKFYDAADYFRVTEGSGDKEKFVKDQFKTNFLTRSVKREKADPVSARLQIDALNKRLSELKSFETTIEILTLKAKRVKDGDKARAEFIESARQAREETERTLNLCEARLFSVDVEKDDADLESAFKSVEKSWDRVIANASRLLELVPTSTNEENTRGALVVNASSSTKKLWWQTRSKDDVSNEQNIDALEEERLIRELSEQSSNVKVRSYAGRDPKIRTYCATLPANASLWTPRSPDLEYRFLARSRFDLDASTPEPFVENEGTAKETASDDVRSQEEGQKTRNAKKRSFFDKLVSKLRVEETNLAADSDGSASEDKTSPPIAEYVVNRYSATEIERFYRLRNNYFEIKIDPVSGSVKRLTTFNSNATFSNGVLRQPTLGNRFAWELALKLPSALLRDDVRSSEDPRYGYTNSAADKIEVFSSPGVMGAVRIEGRLVAPNGELSGKFVQTISARLMSKIVEVDVEIDPISALEQKPWDSYYGCRFAWKDSLADVRGGVGAALIGTTRDYLQAPECVDLRSEDNVGVTILSGGLPYFKKTSDARLDAILIPFGETRRKFRFGIGVDLDDPHAAALAFADPDPTIVLDAPRPKYLSSSPFSLSASNVRVIEMEPIRENVETSEAFIGVRLSILETHSMKTQTTLRSFLPIDKIEAVDLNGRKLQETFNATNANQFELEFKPRQLRVLEVFFKKSSL